MKLNGDRHKENGYPSFNVFNPARQGPNTILGDTKDRRTKLELDVFDKQSVESLQELIQNNFKAYHEANCWIDANRFAVLDERSAKDSAVVIWSKEPVFELDEQVGWEWLSWESASLMLTRGPLILCRIRWDY